MKESRKEYEEAKFAWILHSIEEADKAIAKDLYYQKIKKRLILLLVISLIAIFLSFHIFNGAL